LRAPKVRVGEAVELTLRVLPNDLDINGHMNNGRYLTVVDLALFVLFIRSGFLRLCMKKGWRPMSGGAAIHFRRGLKGFQRYTLRVTPLGWDEFWNYCRFEFIREGELCATGFMKGAAVGRAGLVPNDEFYPALGYSGASPELPADLLGWIAADRLLGERAKR
jgi:acyl-CoA thioesterase FadM